MDDSLIEYELIVRQQPKAARMCGLGGKDRRPIDPPPIIQLRVLEHAPGSSRSSPTVSDGFLQNPYYFMFASLASPDSDEEMHVLKDGKTRCTTGSVVSSLYHLKDPDNDNVDAGFFVFPDLSVRTEGSYRLKLSLFEVKGPKVQHCKSIFSNPFYVYTAKKFPGMEESTKLSCSLADQGIKIRIRKEIRQRKKGGVGPGLVADDDGDEPPQSPPSKRGRVKSSEKGKGREGRQSHSSKRPRLVSDSPKTELKDLSEQPSPQKPLTSTAGAGPSTEAGSWNGSEYPPMPAAQSTAQPSPWSPNAPAPLAPPIASLSSSGDQEFRAPVQHSESPSWGHSLVPSPHTVHTHAQQSYTPTSGYSTTSGSNAGSSSQIISPPPQPSSAPQLQTPGHVGPMPITTRVQQPRQVYDMVAPPGTPYGSPMENHAQPLPTHSASSHPAHQQFPYGRYYVPQQYAQPTSMYQYGPQVNVGPVPGEYASAVPRDSPRERDERHVDRSGPDRDPPPPGTHPQAIAPSASQYGLSPQQQHPQHPHSNYPVSQPLHPHYPSPVPPPASAGYMQQQAYTSGPPQQQQSPVEREHQHHPSMAYETGTYEQPAQGPPQQPPRTMSMPQTSQHLQTGQWQQQQQPYMSYRRHESGPMYGSSSDLSYPGQSSKHTSDSQQRTGGNGAVGENTGPNMPQDGTQQQQHVQNLTLPPMLGAGTEASPYPQHMPQQSRQMVQHAPQGYYTPPGQHSHPRHQPQLQQQHSQQQYQPQQQQVHHQHQRSLSDGTSYGPQPTLYSTSTPPIDGRYDPQGMYQQHQQLQHQQHEHHQQHQQGGGGYKRSIMIPGGNERRPSVRGQPVPASGAVTPVDGSRTNPLSIGHIVSDQPPSS